MTASWQFWIDRGGTFTDVVGQTPRGHLHCLKLLSENPGQYADAAAAGIHKMLRQHGGSNKVAEIRMGTTVATNALLEHAGAATALLTTRGCRDALRIAYQNRPHIFRLNIQHPDVLYKDVQEVTERVTADGQVLTALEEADVHTALQRWQNLGIESVAICFLHAWKNAAHEQHAAQLAQKYGFQQVSYSSDVSPLMKLVSRGDTTVADAYLSPVLRRYVDSFQHSLAELGITCARIRFMQSNGGLVAAERFRGKDSILSGPAGGVVALGAAAAKAGMEQLIGFDMGGTSTDVSVYAGRPELVNETMVAGHYLRTPMIRIHTIAAGGGSILTYRDGRFQVGPESAGAYPGPLSYGHGGPLTITDANLLLGRIQAEHFPSNFGPTADEPLDHNGVVKAFTELAAAITHSSGRLYTPAQTAQGFLRVAIDSMANALAHISIQRGLNPADFSLCSFGGAGGQHACQVADRLGISSILLDPLAGVLSAWGMGAAPLRTYRQRAINQPLNAATLAAFDDWLPELTHACLAELVQQGIASTATQTEIWLELKTAGSDTPISLQLQDEALMRTAFTNAHLARFGFMPVTTAISIDSLRVQVEGGGSATSKILPPVTTKPSAAKPITHSAMHTDDELINVPIYDRANLQPGQQLTGPAIVTEQTGTTVIDSGWELEVNSSLQLLLRRSANRRKQEDIGIEQDPVMLEIFNNQFMHVAAEMGVVLQKTSRSVNIKERLDFSCAIFNPAGELIANAPHIPVHLGSMDDSVKTLLATELEGLHAGNSYLSNAPYNGGTHLPDLTVISPVLDANRKLLFVVAARAHHADIGGTSPGSMPPDSTHIDEEGIVFDNFLLVKEGKLNEQSLLTTLNNGPYPARNPQQNIADFQAQLAANERGRKLLLEMINRYSLSVVHAYAGYALNNAEESVRAAIAKLIQQYGTTGSFEYPFDNGQIICVTVTLDEAKREAHIDFSGTSAATENNLNAPVAVCQAAVMYVFRTLVAADIPLNAGCRRPLHLTIPEGCMLNPRYPAAVVGGNVETSQCITDALYAALGVLAASQGTMNNLTFGNDQLQYYETIAGGAGAGPDFAGASAVQTHMTNSRMTDTEILESRFPVLVREFSIRPDSGGDGLHRGGDGIIRKLEFRAKMSAAILSNHRLVAPFGLAGGTAAKTGENRIERREGTVEQLGAIATTTMREGDVLVIETPGGGGYGTPPATQ